MTRFHFLTTFAILLLHHSLPSHSSPLPINVGNVGNVSPEVPVANPPTCLFPGDTGRALSSDCQSALSQFPNTTSSTLFHTALTPNKTNDFILPLSKSHGTCNITIGLLPSTEDYATATWRQLTNSTAGLIEGCQENFDTVFTTGEKPDMAPFTTGGNTTVVVPTRMPYSSSPQLNVVGWTVKITAADGESGMGGPG